VQTLYYRSAKSSRLEIAQGQFECTESQRRRYYIVITADSATLARAVGALFRDFVDPFGDGLAVATGPRTSNDDGDSKSVF